MQPGIAAVQFEVRLAADGSHVTRGRTDRPSAGNLIITQSILPDTDYQVRGQFVPSTPRDMLWSAWLDVTTPDVRFSLSDFDDALTEMITSLESQDNDQIIETLNRIASIASDIAARAPLDKQELRTQLAARAGAAEALIEEVRIVAVTTEAAFASFSTTATATWGSLTAFVEESATAIATFDGYAAAVWSITTNVDGHVAGIQLINGGSATSAFIVVADKFQIQLPGYNGDAPSSVFTVGTVNGVAAVGISGANMYLDGTLNARAIVAGSITAAKIGAGEITSDSGVIGALAVKSLSIADNAATVPASQTLGSDLSIGAGGTNFFNFNLSVDTTGLSGKTIPIYANVIFKFNCSYSGGGTQSTTFQLFINGTQVDGYTLQLVAQFVILTMAGSVNVTGTGGVVTVPIVARGFAGGGADVVKAGAITFAVAAKR